MVSHCWRASRGTNSEEASYAACARGWASFLSKIEAAPARRRERPRRRGLLPSHSVFVGQGLLSLTESASEILCQSRTVSDLRTYIVFTPLIELAVAHSSLSLKTLQLARLITLFGRRRGADLRLRFGSHRVAIRRDDCGRGRRLDRFGRRRRDARAGAQFGRGASESNSQTRLLS